MSKRIDHGSFAVFEEESGPSSFFPNDLRNLDAPLDRTTPSKLSKYGYLFQLHRNPDNLLLSTDETCSALVDLGISMVFPSKKPALGSHVHSAYTYFAQFIDHDISFTAVSKGALPLVDPCSLSACELGPLSPEEVTRKFANLRLGFLQLDSVYQSPAPRVGDYMQVGPVSPSPFGLAGDDLYQDVPRQSPSADPSTGDRVAQIGDPRNDQTLILSQLHVVFLRAHNALVKRGHSFEAARRVLQQHFHWLIIHDFLRTIADENVVNDVLHNPYPVYDPSPNSFFLPIEFSVAGFRFGHSMVRHQYYYNRNYPGVSLSTLFTYKALEFYPTLPDQKIIDWRRFLKIDDTPNMARPITTSLVEPLFNLVNQGGRPMPCDIRLAVIDLLRGYLWSVPTGQALARAFGYQPKTPEEIEAVAANDQQRAILQKGFSGRTPLWFYILAEAQIEGRKRLGQLGTRLVAEVLIGLIRQSPTSILSVPGWSPSLGKNNQFTIIDLIRLAQLI